MPEIELYLVPFPSGQIGEAVALRVGAADDVLELVVLTDELVGDVVDFRVGKPP